MAKDPYPSETADRYIVRFPEGMRDEIKAAAEKNGRSMNSEIISRLQASLITRDMTATDFLHILDANQVNAVKILDHLRKATDRMETLLAGGVILEDIEDVGEGDL